MQALITAIYCITWLKTISIQIYEILLFHLLSWDDSVA